MPVYISPLYNSEGPSVKVGPHSAALRTLSVESAPQLSKQFKSEWETTPFEVMYVMAIRLYDIGLKDEAAYWFYAAQTRARVFINLLDPSAVGSLGSEAFERKQSVAAFNQLVGEYINGYAFGDIEKLKATILQVKADSANIPRYDTIYPRVKFVSQNQWAGIHQDVLAGNLDKMYEYVVENADKIRETRKANGIDGKY